MSPQKELQVGAAEHKKIVAQFGLYENQKLQAYVHEIGARVARRTERPDVTYRFYILDTPIVNAFALPGGYIYLTRGLLALADNEAEVAAVLAHEIGHVTGRHSAERYSTGVITSLGTTILSAAVDDNDLTQALGVGSNLYLKSYSRAQENEADTLGLRYMAHGEYDTVAMATFLTSLQNYSALQAKIEGRPASQGLSYFSTHPATADRIQKTVSEARQYNQAEAIVNSERHLQAINGMTFGDSVQHGFEKGGSFFHPALGFAFDVPQGFRVINQPDQVILSSTNTGAIMIFDLARARLENNSMAYLTQIWMKGEPLQAPERIMINGKKAVTAYFDGRVNGKPMTIRLIAIEWKPYQYARFQIAIPQQAPRNLVDRLKSASYSFRSLTEQERGSLKPSVVKIVTAQKGDSVGSLARRQLFSSLQQERFRVLNSLRQEEEVVPGNTYKLVVDY